MTTVPWVPLVSAMTVRPACRRDSVSASLSLARTLIALAPCPRPSRWRVVDGVRGVVDVGHRDVDGGRVDVSGRGRRPIV